MKDALLRWKVRRFARSLESRGYYMAADAVRSVEWPYIPPYMKEPKLRIRWGSVASYLVAGGTGHIFSMAFDLLPGIEVVVVSLFLFLVFLYVSPAIVREWDE